MSHHLHETCTQLDFPDGGWRGWGWLWQPVERPARPETVGLDSISYLKEWNHWISLRRCPSHSSIFHRYNVLYFMNVTCREEKRRERTRFSVECWVQLDVEFRDRHIHSGCVRLLAILWLMFSEGIWRLGRINAPDSNTKKYKLFCDKIWWWWTQNETNTIADENLFEHSFITLWWSLSPDSNTFWMNRNTILSQTWSLLDLSVWVGSDPRHIRGKDWSLKSGGW